MAKKYLDYDGLLYFWQKIKTTFAQASHTHTKSEITDFPSTMTPSSHTHGNIQNGGTLQTTDVAVANGDKLVITDSSDSNKVARSSVSFDGSTETQALTKKGTWATFNNYVHPTTTAHTASAVKVGNDSSGHVVLGDALKTSDLTNDSGFITSANVPVASSTTPNMDGTASVGTETAFARGDHTHPTDTSRASASHVHGNITNDGKITASGVAVANGDTLVIVDSSDSSKVKKTSIAFDGSSDRYGLTKKGTWEHMPVVMSSSGEDANLKHIILGYYNADGTSSSEGQATSIELLSVQAINNVNQSLVSAVQTALDGKVDKVTGKGLSTNDYTDAEKTKLGKLVFDGNDLIDSSILPSYVDDVIEAYARSGQTALSSTWLATGSASGTVITPETGKIYVLMADSGDYSANTQFRWSGTTYVKLADGGVSSITNAEIDTILAS